MQDVVRILQNRTKKAYISGITNFLKRRLIGGQKALFDSLRYNGTQSVLLTLINQTPPGIGSISQS